MASAVVRAAFLARVAAHWTATPVRSAGEGLQPPADGSGLLYVEFPIGQEEQTSIGAPGANIQTETGVARCVYMAPKTSDVAAATAALDALRVHFRSQRFGPEGRILALSPSPPSEPWPVGAWQEISFSTEYLYHFEG